MDQERERQCPYMRSCHLFRTLRLSASVEVIKIQYCTSDYRGCERYGLRSSGQRVPDEMWPDGTVPGGV